MAEEKNEVEQLTNAQVEVSSSEQGPDPVWGVGVGIIGLLTMATGGALTWHWVFNVGELVMLIGAAMFLGAVTLTSLKQRPLRFRMPWASRAEEEAPASASASTE